MRTFLILFIAFVLPAGAWAQESSKETEQIDFAAGLFQRALYDMAYKEYQKYLQTYPAGSYIEESHFGMAESLLFKENYEQALAAYNQYLTTFPEGKYRSIALLRLGQSSFMMKELQKAATFLAQVDQGKLNEVFFQALYYFKGQVAKSQGRMQEAIENFTLATQDQGENQYTSLAYSHLGDIAFQNKQFKEAADYYSKASTSAFTDETKSTSLHRQGEALFSGGDFEGAIGVFQELIRAFPEQDIRYDGLTNLLMAYYNLKQFDSLVNVFQKYEAALGQSPKIFNIYYIVVNAYQELDRPDDALSAINKVLNASFIAPEDQYKGLLKKAEILVRAQKFPESIALLEDKAAPIRVDDPQFIFLKAESLYGVGRMEEAATLYQSLINEYADSIYADEALHALAHVLKDLGRTDEALNKFLDYSQKGHDPRRQAQALFNVIYLKRSQNDIEAAIEKANQYVNQFKDQPDYEKVLFWSGDLYSTHGKYVESNDVFNRYISEFPNGAFKSPVLFLLGFNHQSLVNNEEALKFYAEVPPGESEEDRRYFSIAQKNMAVIYLEREEMAKAAQIYDRLISSPDWEQIGAKNYFWVIERYLKENRPDDALRILSQLEKSSALTDMDRIALSFFRAEGYRQQKKCDEALKSYDMALAQKESNPFLAGSYLGKGLCFIEKQDFEQAKKEITAAMESNPEDYAAAIKAKMAMADIETTLGQIEEAIKYYMLVAVLYKDEEYTPLALFKAAELMEKSQRPTEALSAYQEIISQYPQSPLKDQSLTKIQSLSSHAKQ